jgi:hypothetical protein
MNLIKSITPLQTKRFKSWLIKYITNNPDVAYGSIWRDVCILCRIKVMYKDVYMNKALDELVSDGSVTITKRNNDTFYNLGKEYERENKLKAILK